MQETLTNVGLRSGLEELWSRDPAMAGLVQETWRILGELAAAGRRNWVVAFSGGKDSTTLLILTTEFLLKTGAREIQVDVLYADTRLEIPPLYQSAIAVLAYLGAIAERRRLSVRIHHVASPLTESFWTLLLGRGYPVPGPRFRWCTDRLKVKPMTRKLKELSSDSHEPVLLVAVRRGESSARDGRLNVTCGRGGECGQGALVQFGRMTTSLPILKWPTCKVWDFLAVQAPEWGWPTQALCGLYGFDERVRFGCWVCTLVKEDRAIAAAIESGNGNVNELRELAAFREKLVARSRDIRNRVQRPDGRPGKLTLAARERLFSELLELQAKVGLALISPAESTYIRALWRQEKAQAKGGEHE